MKSIFISIMVLAWVMAAYGFILITKPNLPGRYQIATSGQVGAVVLDTKTGHLWVRTANVCWDLGTNTHPIFKEVEVENQESDNAPSVEEMLKFVPGLQTQK